MSNGSKLLLVLFVGEGGEGSDGIVSEGIVSANGLGGDGGRRGGIELQPGMELLLGGTSFRRRVMGLRIFRAGGTGPDEDGLGGGDGWSATKSARSSPGGRDGGHRHLRFGVEGKRLSGEVVGVDGRLRARLDSQADNRRRFLEPREESCASEVAAALVIAIGLWRSGRGGRGSGWDARGGVAREEEVLLARRDCKAIQVAWMLLVVV